MATSDETPPDGARPRRGAGTTARRSAGTPYELGSFVHDGVRLAYEVHGTGEQVLVFLHAILLSSELNRRLAGDLAAAGHRVVLLDLPGHGRSDKPRRASAHRIDTYARHVIALLDHLGVDRAVVGGVSLGGNVSLMVAALAPERVQGLVVEMPVLEWAVPAAALTFVPLLFAVHFARPVAATMASVVRRVPRTRLGPLDSVLGTLANDPRETAAVLHGVLAGPLGPTVDERAAMAVPALVIGHRSDGVHPFHDAEQLADRLPEARLVQARSIFELRVRPERLTGEIVALLDEAWGRDTGGRAGAPRAGCRAG
jgi:pimeloyl-ACP methyl ester carboxylesterase